MKDYLLSFEYGLMAVVSIGAVSSSMDFIKHKIMKHLKKTENNEH